MNPESMNLDSKPVATPDFNKALAELNENAAQTDMPQDQYETTLASIENAHADLESTFAVPEVAVEAPEIEVEVAEAVVETPEAEAEAEVAEAVAETTDAEADLGGRAVRAAVDIVGAIEDAHAEAQNEERTYVAADLAMNYEKERQELLGLEDFAAHQDWPQDKFEAAQAEVKAKYAKSK
jgi:hypothetical protein